MDVRSAKVGSLGLTLLLREEGTFGNPANGQHFQVLCSRSGEPVQIARGYWVEGGLERAPIERIVLDPSGFVFTDVVGGAVFWFDSCRNVSFWKGILPPELASSVELNDQLDEVDTVVFCPGGPQIAFRVSSEVFEGGARLWAQSTDGGRDWLVKTSLSAPELCASQRQIPCPRSSGDNDN